VKGGRHRARHQAVLRRGGAGGRAGGGPEERVRLAGASLRGGGGLECEGQVTRKA
jgi:hypothetical protein